MTYTVDHIPKGTAKNRRPALALNATTITIHNTGNPSSSARGECNWLTNPSNDRTASYHIVIDEKEAIECIPLNENAWHAGDGSGTGTGNRTSIGIEICESGNYAKTLDNAVQLIAGMLRERGWGVDRLRRHYDWSGKICPRLMYDGGSWASWEVFKRRVAEQLNKGDVEKMKALEEAIAALAARVEKLEKRIDAPKWFAAEFGSADLGGIIHDPKFTEQDWRTIATVLRALKYKPPA